MGFRETVNRNQPVVIGVVLLTILIAGYVIFSQARGVGSRKVTRVYYTVDDGKTWFDDDIEKVPPFLVDGKEAVKVDVMDCKGTKFAGVLQKYTPETKQVLEKAYQEKQSGKVSTQTAAVAQARANPGSILFKKPGAKDWMSANQARTQMDDVGKCPDGSYAETIYP